MKANATTYIALLRGINVGGHRKINMKELKALLEELGLQDVRTYIQSGNIVFNHTAIEEQSLTAQIETKLKDHYGFDVPTLIRTQAELAECIEQNPFLSDNEPDLKQLYTTFLSAEPDQSRVDSLSAMQYGADEFRIMGRTIYLYCRGGYGNTALTNLLFEQKLKVPATTRNWRTINELKRMAENLV